jgi:exodeoxyribonuclease III
MLLLCWNVAGFSTTVHRIHQLYQGGTVRSTSNDDTTASPPSLPIDSKHPASSLATFFAHHQADLVCLQEHKIPSSQLQDRTEPRQCATLPGYESFWSCSVDASCRGMNGVVTYAKRGTVFRANAQILQPSHLNDQGRCIVTYHDQFVLFNVYVPASGGQPLGSKMQFLRALRRAMHRERERTQKPIILVGDYNIAPTKHDIYGPDRLVHVNEILQQQQKQPNTSSPPTNNPYATTPSWQLDLVEHWSTIKDALQNSIQAVPAQTTNPQTGEKFNKYRVQVTQGDKKVFLGKFESSPECALYPWNLEARTYYDPDVDEELPCHPADTLSISNLAELVNKLVGIEWDAATLQSIADSDAVDINRIAPPRVWFQTLLQEDGMVDCFRHLYPMAQGRFTCWNQSTNRRYANDGARIDLTLADADLVCKLQPLSCDNALRCATKLDTRVNPLSVEAAARAATAGGRFQAASYQGGGIQEASQEALLSQFGPPHTGMIYTPPSYSDHIAISLYMDDTILPNTLTLLEKDIMTRKCQPHKAQRTMTAFVVQGEAAIALQKTTTTSSTASRLLLTKRPTLESASKTPDRKRKNGAKPATNHTLMNYFAKSRTKES